MLHDHDLFESFGNPYCAQLLYSNATSSNKPFVSIQIKTCGSASAAKKPCDAQVCYLLEPLFTSFHAILVQKLLELFLQNSYYYVVELIYTTSQTNL